MNNKYGVVIIGAGIGGLVCGCYLAKSGLKVLIVEQHSIPGGYCTSFKRKGFIFDVGVHYLGSLREDGILSKILKDLGILSRIKFLRCDPIDRIMAPDKTIFIRKDKEKTIEELILNFPDEKVNVINFFKFILNTDFLNIISKTKKITFKELLNSFFKDSRLKAILSIPLGNLGLSSSHASALVSVVLFKEFILDGGYYPEGGIQALPDLLTDRLKELGGEILLSTKVKKIITSNKKALGIKLESGEFISAKYIVSNADATMTFNALLDCSSKEAGITNRLEPSFSAFVIYLGLNKKLDFIPKHLATWYFSTYNIDNCYNNLLKPTEFNLNCILCTFPSFVEPNLAPLGKDTVKILIGPAYENKNIWDKYKEDIFEKVIEVTNKVVPNLKDYIEVKEIATPHTFNKFTSNRDGALFGWSASPAQIDRSVFPPETSIENLYLAGHWVINGIGQSGIAVVALSGRTTARIIIRNR